MRLFPFRRSAGRRSRDHVPASLLRPETKQAAIGVILVVFSLIVLLSFFDLAGAAGAAILSGLRRLFGWLAYAVPAVLGLVSVVFIRPRSAPLGRLRTVGAVLAVIGVLGMLHLASFSVDDGLQAAHEGKGGGYLGFLFSYPLALAFSRVAASLIFACSLLVGVFLAFDVTVHDLWRWLRQLLPVSEGEVAAEAADDGLEPEVTVAPLADGHEADPVQLKRQQEQQQRLEQDQQEKMRQQLRAANRKYRPPSLDLLHLSIGKPNSGDTEAKKEKIRRTLENFGIAVAMGKVNVGPTVTQFTLRPEEGIKLSRITALQNDLALALAAHPIRIEAPIPNKDLVGIEIPNEDVSLVRLRDLLSARSFRSAESPLTIVLGKDVSGQVITASLERMPHLLIAGATGSGKSIFINTVLLSLLYRNSPDLVRVILVDPKRVELALYDGIPHLLTPVIIESEKTIHALRWLVREMDRRYRLLSEAGARNLLSFNLSNADNALPFIVVVIDELADLMAKHARDVEGAIVRLSQMARAVGIHLVLATQRPSVNVITGLIKANIPARIAFTVASQVDSRTIIDSGGAEKLLGSGDMLYLAGDQAKPVRLQGGFVSEEETRRVVESIQSAETESTYDEAITMPARETGELAGDASEDSLFEEARRVVVQSRKASASLLQRRLRVGYARAARLLDILEEQGVIGQAEGNKPREVLTRDAERDAYATELPEDRERPGPPPQFS